VPLKFKIWLGKLFGWDKAGIRAILFLATAFTLILAVEYGYNSLTDDGGSESCDQACRDAVLDRYMDDEAPDPQRTLDDILGD
jgi:hypothetical protein